MTTQKSQYQQLGVDASKESVRAAFSSIVDNEFPGAFVNIVRHPTQPGVVSTMHSDGDGSKSRQRWLHYRETGDVEILQGEVDDGWVMNTADVSASGFVFGPWFINQTIGVNGFRIPKALLLEQNALRVRSLLALYRERGFGPISFLGGETADLPNQIDSSVYDVGIYAETREENVIAGNTKAGDVIFGFASNGQAEWEKETNTGVMSNGLTLGQVCLMHSDYNSKYPYLVGGGKPYRGKFKVTDKPEILGGMTVSQALLSPTRQWPFLIRLLMEMLKSKGISHQLHGISINTGGGATKITHVGKGIEYNKVMPEPPQIFHLIKAESGEKWRDMYQGFNCGVGLDVVGENNCEFMQVLVDVSQQTGVELFRLGTCQQSPTGKNRVVLNTPYGNFDDYK